MPEEPVFTLDHVCHTTQIECEALNLVRAGRAALATEMPTPDLLLEKPHGRNEPLISRRMWKHVIVQGLYQLFWLFLIIYGAPAQLPAFAVRACCGAWVGQDKVMRHVVG